MRPSLRSEFRGRSFSRHDEDRNETVENDANCVNLMLRFRLTKTDRLSSRHTMEIHSRIKNTLENELFKESFVEVQIPLSSGRLIRKLK